MESEELVVGKKYELRGKEDYYPPGLGAVERERFFTATGEFCRINDGKPFFINCVIRYDNQRVPIMGGRSFDPETIESIVEVGK